MFESAGFTLAAHFDEDAGAASSLVTRARLTDFFVSVTSLFSTAEVPVMGSSPFSSAEVIGGVGAVVVEGREEVVAMAGEGEIGEVAGWRRNSRKSSTLEGC
jgi:hypothetical protein